MKELKVELRIQVVENDGVFHLRIGSRDESPAEMLKSVVEEAGDQRELAIALDFYHMILRAVQVTQRTSGDLFGQAGEALENGDYEKAAEIFSENICDVHEDIGMQQNDGIVRALSAVATGADEVVTEFQKKSEA